MALTCRNEFSVRLCSFIALLHPSQITSSVSIALPIIPKQHLNYFS